MSNNTENTEVTKEVVERKPLTSSPSRFVKPHFSTRASCDALWKKRHTKRFTHKDVVFDEHRARIAYKPRRNLQRLTLAWKSIDVYCRSGTVLKSWNNMKDAQHILKGVCGVVQPGKLVAIMGPSGAGKTTLMDALAGRIKPNMIVSGQVLVNGCQIGSLMEDIGAYVQQENVFIPTITVKELLTFRAFLRLSKTCTDEYLYSRVNEVLADLCLTKCANSIIGDGRIRGITEGEKKRVAVASEIISDPPIIFVDEPTSGLDSTLAKKLIQCLKNMTGQGKIILITINQPTSDIYSLFDDLLLLADGNVIYMGSREEAVEHFQECCLMCPNNYNPAEYFLEILGYDAYSQEEYYITINNLAAYFKDSEDGRRIQSYLKLVKGVAVHEFMESTPIIYYREKYRVSFFTQFSQLIWRCWVIQIRDPAGLKFRSIQVLLGSLLLGLMFYGQELNQHGVANLNSFIFFMVVCVGLSTQFMVMDVFSTEMKVLMHEFAHNLYSLYVYFICKTLVDILSHSTLPLVFNIIVNAFVGYAPDFKSFIFATSVLIIDSNIAGAFGLFVAAVCGKINVALAISPSLITPLIVMGGMLMNSGLIPVYVLWVKYVSWFSFSTELLTVNHWETVGNITCNDHKPCYYHTGEDVLYDLYFDETKMVTKFIMLASQYIIYRFIGFLVLLARLSALKNPVVDLSFRDESVTDDEESR